MGGQRGEGQGQRGGRRWGRPRPPRGHGDGFGLVEGRQYRRVVSRLGTLRSKFSGHLCKGPDGEHCCHCGPCGRCHRCSAVPLWHRQAAAAPCSSTSSRAQSGSWPEAADPGLAFEFPGQPRLRMSSSLAFRNPRLPHSQLPFPPLAREESGSFALRLLHALTSLAVLTYFQLLRTSTWGLESSLAWPHASSLMSLLLSTSKLISSSHTFGNQTEHTSVLQCLWPLC